VALAEAAPSKRSKLGDSLFDSRKRWSLGKEFPREIAERHACGRLLPAYE
jgi:hypothetical protein